VVQRDELLAILAAARERGEEPELIAAHLTGLDLGGVDLSGAALNDACLRGADLRRANLTDTFLSGADLRDADLRGADLTGAFLDGALLDGSRLRGAILRGTYMAETDLTGVDMRGVDLAVADHEILPSLAGEGDENDFAGADVDKEAPPAPPLTAAQRRLPGLAAPTTGATLPVRLGEEFGSRRAVAPLGGLALLVGILCIFVLGLSLRSFFSAHSNYTITDRDDLGVAIISFLSGPGIIIIFAVLITAGAAQPFLRHRRAAREELATIVEIERETVRPGQRARLHVELRRAAPVTAVAVAAVCLEVSRGSNGMRRRQVEFIPLVRTRRLTLPPGATWRDDRVFTIPRDARRHNFDPRSAVWVSWAIQVIVESPGAPPRTQTFPFRVE
jgi:hypothetical protein